MSPLVYRLLAQTDVAPHLGMYAFFGGGVLLLSVFAFLLRGALRALSNVAAEHAQKYALAYTKGAALILIAMFASFQETWGMVTASDVRLWQWWDFFIALTKPVAAGLAVLVAFLDRSLSNADTPPPPPKP